MTALTRRLRILLFVLLGLALVASAGTYAAWRYFYGDMEGEAVRLFEILELEPGATIAEIGAGGGGMSLLIAGHLGSEGKVYATEIGAESLGKLRDAVAEAGAESVSVLEAAATATNLPQECCEAIYLRKVYHHITDPAAYNASLLESLQPGGRLAIIDFAPGSWRRVLPKVEGAPSNRGGHGMPPDLLVEELTAAGFEFDQRIDRWQAMNYCVVVRKPQAQ